MRKFPFLMDSIDWNMPINIHLFMYRRISVKRFIIIGKQPDRYQNTELTKSVAK